MDIFIIIAIIVIVAAISVVVFIGLYDIDWKEVAYKKEKKHVYLVEIHLNTKCMTEFIKSASIDEALSLIYIKYVNKYGKKAVKLITAENMYESKAYFATLDK